MVLGGRLGRWGRPGGFWRLLEALGAENRQNRPDRSETQKKVTNDVGFRAKRVLFFDFAVLRDFWKISLFGRKATTAL